MVCRNAVRKADTLRGQGQIIVELLVWRSRQRWRWRRRRLLGIVDKNEDRVSLLLAGRVKAQQNSNQVNLKEIKTQTMLSYFSISKYVIHQNSQFYDNGKGINLHWHNLTKMEKLQTWNEMFLIINYNGPCLFLTKWLLFKLK